MVRFAALLAFCSLAVHAELNPEAGAFLFQKYSAKDYAANPQNWAFTQDSRGIIFVANTDGILEFDGVLWRRIAIPSQSVLSLASDAHGVMYIGGQGTFGYLSGDKQGAFRFVSLLDKLPPTERSFGSVWDVLPTSDGVYFSARRRLFLYTPSGELRVFRPSQRFGRAFLFHDQLFITSTDRGLFTIRRGHLIPVSGGDEEAMRRSPIYAPGNVPLLASGDKIYRFSPGAVSRFLTGADDYFKTHEINCLRYLPSGDIAVGTTNGGLVFLDRQGRLERIVRTANGLPSDRINAIFTDRQQNIWLATDSGIVRYSSRLSSFGETQGLRGNVYALNRFSTGLYAGTSLGLFRLNVNPATEPSFQPVPGIRAAVFVLAEQSGMALAGTEQGLYQIRNGTAQNLSQRVIYDISFSRRDPDVFYTAGANGIEKLRLTGGNLTVISREQGGGQDFRSVLEADDGAVWGTTSDRIWRVHFEDPSKPSEEFGLAQGVPAGWTNVYRLRDHVLFAANKKGLLGFDEKAKRFVPDNELGDRFAQTPVSLVRQDPRKNIWIGGTGYQGILYPSGWFPQPLQETGIGEIYGLQLDNNGAAWVSGATGTLYRYLERPNLPGDDLSVLLRSVFLTNREKVIYEGDAPEEKNLRLPYRDNAIRFEFAAPFFSAASSIEYQVRLEGTETQWSPWTTENRKDYTNLPERAYTFRVRARDPHGHISPEATFHFRLLAPWYRTWWAFAFYVAAFLFAGWLILRWRLRALEARNKWLEQVVEQRTAEVRTERDQNEALLLNILPKPVASELRNTGAVKPTAFDEVTVCFSDFVGFTLSSEKLPANVLIDSLNEYFTAFDEIIGRYGLEKLKTIGDAYMFAGGLPDASSSHAVDSVLAALEMVDVVRRLAKPDKGINWSIRLGLYSGPVVAGVVGVRKFAFDIWGNTVNFAARMESAGAADRVNLSATTGARVFDFIECEPRGPVRIKEGREMDMYFALRPRSELTLGPLIDGIPAAFRAKYLQVFSKPPRAFPNLNGAHG